MSYKLYCVLHALERSRHKGGESNHLYILLNSRIDNKLGVNVPAEVNNGVAVVIKQYLYDILADVVNVALDRCKDNLALADGRADCF